MIRVAVVDDHYAVRIGLTSALSTQADMEAVGAASTAAELAPLLYRTAPDVVVLDYRLPDTDGLTLCRRIKGEPLAPAIVLHSAFADDWLLIPAMLAGADGVVHKGAPGRELAETIRTVAAGASALPPVDPELLRASAESLDPEDLPILGMLAHGVPASDVADVLALDSASLRKRQDRMIAALRAPSHRQMARVGARGTRGNPNTSFA